MIIEVDMYENTRQLYVDESKSQRQIASLLGISRITVKKYCEGAQVPWERSGTSGILSSMEVEQPDTSTPPNRIAASRFAPLGWWDVVNTTTLSETLNSK